MTEANRQPAGKRRAPVFLLVSGCMGAAWLVLALGLFPAKGFYSPDSALKWLQVRSLRFAPGLLTSLHYHGRGYDPLLHSVPLGETFFVVRGGEIELVWPPWFALICWPWHALFGARGMRIVPALAAFVCTLASAWIAGRWFGPRARLPALVLATFATPLLVYGGLVWEHTLAAALAMLALWQWLESAEGKSRAGAIWAGAGFALACAMRAEIGLLCAALFAAGISAGPTQRRVTLRSAIALACAVAPFAVWNATKLDFVMPANAALNFSHPSLEYLRQAGAGAFAEFLWGSADRLALAASFGVGLALVASRLRASPVQQAARMLGLALAALGALISTWRHLHAEQTALHGVLEAAPWLLLGLCFKPRPDAPPSALLLQRTAAGYSGLYLISVLLLSWTGPNGGREWGPRFALALYPLSIPLLLAYLQQARSEAPLLRAASSSFAGVFVALALLVQLRGVTLIARAERVLDGLAERMLHIPVNEPILAMDWWIPTLLVAEFERRPIFWVQNGFTWNEVLLRAACAGQTRFWLVNDKLPEQVSFRTLTLPDLQVESIAYMDFALIQLRVLSLHGSNPEWCKLFASEAKH